MFEFKQVSVKSNPDIVAEKTGRKRQEPGVFRPNVHTPEMFARGEIHAMIMKYIEEINTLAAKRKS